MFDRGKSNNVELIYHICYEMSSIILVKAFDLCPGFFFTRREEVAGVKLRRRVDKNFSIDPNLQFNEDLN